MLLCKRQEDDKLFRFSTAKWQSTKNDGGVAQLGERLPCTQEVIGSIPFTSTIFFPSYVLRVSFQVMELNSQDVMPGKV